MWISSSHLLPAQAQSRLQMCMIFYFVCLTTSQQLNSEITAEEEYPDPSEVVLKDCWSCWEFLVKEIGVKDERCLCLSAALANRGSKRPIFLAAMLDMSPEFYCLPSLNLCNKTYHKYRLRIGMWGGSFSNNVFRSRITTQGELERGLLPAEKTIRENNNVPPSKLKHELGLLDPSLS